VTNPNPAPCAARTYSDTCQTWASCYFVAGDKFERIVDYELGPMPEPVPACVSEDPDFDDIPF
jgi:hypothetical protein